MVKWLLITPAIPEPSEVGILLYEKMMANFNEKFSEFGELGEEIEGDLGDLITINITIYYLAGYIRQETDAEVDILDLNFQEVDIGAKILSGKYDFVGITGLTEQHGQVMDVCKVIRDASPGTKIILGGPHFTFIDQIALETGLCDMVVRGEGEFALKNLSQGKEFKDIPGASFFDENKDLIRNECPPPVDLNGLPLPALDLLPIDASSCGGIVSGSRGCLNKCTFCSSQNLFPKLRVMNAENVLINIDHFIEAGFPFVLFSDDTFTVNRKRVSTILKGLRERQIPWACDTRTDQVDVPLLQEMVESGCVFVGFGIESGSQKVLDGIQKGTTVELNTKILKAARDVGLLTYSYFILGTLPETPETLEETIRYVENGKKEGWIQAMVPYINVPFPGTPAYEEKKFEGICLDFDNYLDYTKPFYKHANFPDDKNYIYEAFLKLVDLA
ncbi:MAG: B12-binding domain-containing radical SAM protein [Candidatus Hodarchaeota archaeon]